MPQWTQKFAGVPLPLPADEDRALDVEPEGVVLRWAAVPFSDQKTDEALLAEPGDAYVARVAPTVACDAPMRSSR